MKGRHTQRYRDGDRQRQTEAEGYIDREGRLIDTSDIYMSGDTDIRIDRALGR